MNFRLLNCVVLAGALAVSVSSQASIIVYNLTNVSTSAGTLTGTVSINTASDLVTAADVTFNDSAVNPAPVYTTVQSASLFSYNGISTAGIAGSAGQLQLYFDTANIGTAGSLGICISGGPCGSPNDSQTSYSQLYVSPYESYDLTGGTLTLASSPEPSTLLLLGSGLVGVAGAARRRLQRA